LDEAPIIAAILQDRRAFDRLAGKLDPNDFSEYGQLIIKAAVQYYKRDPAASTVDRDVLGSHIGRMFPSPKQASAALEYLASIPSDVSTENVVTEYRMLRRRRVGFDLAAALAAKDPDDETIDKLIDKYRDLSLEQAGETPRPSMADLMARSGERLPLSPSVLNEKVNGGLMRGDHVVVFGRPNAAKTMFLIHQAAAWLVRGYKGLYVCNEESRERVYARFESRMGRGIATWTEIMNDPGGVGTKAEAAALEHGLDNLALIHEPSGKLAALESLIRIHKPDFVIVDQMRNLKSNGQNRVLELEEVAREIRRMAGTYNCVAISATQAGDSAEDKLYLTMGDIDWSNTGIQAACDLIIGIGSDAKYRAHRRRMINGLKNKLGPEDFHFVAFLEPDYNAYRAKPRRKSDDE